MSPTIAQMIFWVAAGCCLVAQIALVSSAIRSPMPGSPDNAVVMPRRSIEIAWTIVPTIALALVLIFTWRAMHPPVRSHDVQNMPAGHRMIEE
jgi:heme/copper-type cytochrome/quinol oxidase subunit 2